MVGIPPPIPGIPAPIPGIPGIDGIFPEPIIFIIFAICFRDSSSWLTCSTVVPAPAAMRWRRDMSMTCGTRRSCGVIERMIPSTRFSWRSSTWSSPSSCLPMPGIILRMPWSGPMPLQHLVAGEEVVERELALHHAALEVFLLVVGDRRLGALDEREDVAHAEDPRRHAVGVEPVEVVELLAGRRELDRLAGDAADGERRAAARVAVELREDDAVEVDPLLERRRDVDGFLAGHRVENEERVRRLRLVAHRGELVHERLVDAEAAGGVEDDGVAAVGAWPARGRRARP